MSKRRFVFVFDFEFFALLHVFLVICRLPLPPFFPNFFENDFKVSALTFVLHLAHPKSFSLIIKIYTN